MPSRKQVNLTALEGLGEDFTEPVTKLVPPKKKAAPKAFEPEEAPAPAKTLRVDSREGKDQIAAYIDEDLKARFKILAIKERRKEWQLVQEAIEMLLAKYNA